MINMILMSSLYLPFLIFQILLGINIHTILIESRVYKVRKMRLKRC